MKKIAFLIVVWFVIFVCYGVYTNVSKAAEPKLVWKIKTITSDSLFTNDTYKQVIDFLNKLPCERSAEAKVKLPGYMESYAIILYRE